jgi:hypothetical protein
MHVASASLVPWLSVNHYVRNRKEETMHPTLRLGSKLAALVAALLLVGHAVAQAPGIAAPTSIPQVYKMTISDGLASTVHYFVEGGSPHLQALGKALQFTENEVNLTSDLQRLRLGIVANENAQQLGFGLIGAPGDPGWCPPPDSSLKRALIPGLAHEATPAAAYQLINLWERMQTELQAEQAKAAAGVKGAPHARPNAQPAAPATAPVPDPQPKTPATRPGAAPPAAPVTAPAPAIPQPLSMPADSAALEQQVLQSQESMRQAVRQLQQQIRQKLPEIMHRHAQLDAQSH